MRLVDLSIKTKLIVAAGVLFAASVGAITFAGSSIMAASAERDAEAQTRALLAGYGQTIAGEIGRAVDTARTTALAAEGLLQADAVDRDALGSLMTSVVAQNPEFVGMALAFEPNALDGRDADFVDHPLADASGRFVPYFFRRADGTVGVDRLVMTAEAGTESWYDRPVREDRSLLTAPYLYPVDGKDVLMTTVSVVVHKEAQPVGITTVDLALDNITSFVSDLKPFGEGSVALVGTDDLWIANAEASLLGQAVEDATIASLIRAAAEDGIGEALVADAEGVDQFLAVEPVAFPGVDERWYLVMTVPQATRIAGAIEARNTMVLVSLATLTVVLGLAWLGARAIARPIAEMTARMRTLAAGDTAIDLAATDRRDEIGDMARAVDVFRTNALERVALERAQADDQTARLERQGRIEALIDRFRDSAQALIRQARTASADLGRVSTELTAVATQSAGRADSARSASSQAAANVQSVATAADELSASIGEISQQVARTTSIVGQATEGVGVTSEKVADLASAATKIGEVVSLISDIASQTNLLALNATIEAARAGEAGKGFAVVASEVKALANQTAKATEEIAAQITAIQQATKEAVDAIRAISGTMGDVGTYSSAIASAVERQGAVTGAIGANVASAESGAATVAQDIDQLTAAVKETNASATRVLGASTIVNEMTERLEGEIDRFLRSVAAA